MGAEHVVVVPHTHWDREWYRTHEQFRVRLVRLVDRLLELLEADPGYRHFMLDGQTIVLDDYLAVRPEARDRIEKLVREGRLLVGPWHVLPDEWLVSGEALVRNLRTGLRRAAAFGGAMPLGYVPDQFGHVGQLPQLFARLGFHGAALWRGVGADVEDLAFWWQAPDGSRVFTLYFPFGYSQGASLPLEPEALAQRLAVLRGQLAPFARRVRTAVLMNGSDHLEPQAGLPEALVAAAARLGDVRLEIGTLPDALRRIHAELGGDAPVHVGELRSGLRAPLLPGCASAHLHQKQREFANDHLLVHEVEPLAAWAGVLGAPVDHGLLRFTWDVALENHPHDSICGCSVDAVHAQMEPRFDRVHELGEAQRGRYQGALAQRLVRPPAAPRAGEPLAVWNPVAAGAALVEGEVELELPGLDGEHLRAGARVPIHLQAGDGRTIPAAAVVAAPGFRWQSPFSRALAANFLPGLEREVFYYHANRVDWRREGGTLVVEARIGSESRGDLDVDGTKRALAAALADPATEALRIDARHPARLRVRFVDTLPGQGLRLLRPVRGRAPGTEGPAAGKLAGGGAFVESRDWRVEADATGRVALVHRRDGTRIDDAFRVVSEADAGDTYNFDPLPAEPVVERPERARVRTTPPTDVDAELSVSLRLRVPAGLDATHRARTKRTVALPVELRIRVVQGLDRVDVTVLGDNTARDHRLRLHCRAPFPAARLHVESAFEVVERPIAPAEDAFGPGRPAELPVGAGPQRRFATLSGDGRALTVAARGSSEVEAVPEADGTTSLAVTLLRAVGWLSRNGLRLRPGPAGPVIPTPAAQVPGPFSAALSLRLHAADDPTRTAEAHRFAHPPRLFPPGEGAGTALGDDARLVEIDDPEVVVSALEPGAEGTLLVRLYEGAGRARRLAGRIPGAMRIEAVDLRGEPESRVALETTGDRFACALGAWQIVDLRARFGAP